MRRERDRKICRVVEGTMVRRRKIEKVIKIGNIAAKKNRYYFKGQVTSYVIGSYD